MSPTSYQAAPPRATTIADARSPVKSAQQPSSIFMPCFQSVLATGYHSLYGVLSKGETRGELECTSTIPVLVCSVLSTTLSNCGTQSFPPVIWSTGTWRRYPACTKSSRDCGAACLSSV